MKVSRYIDTALIYESLIDHNFDIKAISEAIATDNTDDIKTEVDLKPINTDNVDTEVDQTQETPKSRDDKSGKKKGVRPLDTQDFTDTEKMDPIEDHKTYQDKLKKLLVLAYKTSYDNENKAKSKEAKSGYQTIMHLAKVIYKNIDQIKGPEQISQVLKHIENGRNRYIEVARSYQQFYNSLNNL